MRQVEIFDVEIFDLDGTLWIPTNVPLCVAEDRLSHPRWAKHPKDYVLLPNVKETIAALHQNGAEILICTNQGGLPWNVEQGQKCAQKGVDFRPYKTWLHFQQEIAHLRSLLPEVGDVWCSPGAKSGLILIGSSNFFQFHLMPGVECHKPAPTMLLEIWKKYPDATFRFWGDRPTDQQCAIAAQQHGMPLSFEWAHNIQTGMELLYAV